MKDGKQSLGKENTFKSRTMKVLLRAILRKVGKSTLLLKGSEKDVARILYEHGMYFKIESDIGTYFNGNHRSGSTIYIGSNDNTNEIAKFIEQELSDYLEDGATAEFANGRKLAIGSGSDIELAPRVLACFDVAKTNFGWLERNKKYSEHGLPTWTGHGGIPMLRKFEQEWADAERNWQQLSLSQKKILVYKVYGESRRELVKDFGQEFLLGRDNTIDFKLDSQ